MICARCGEHTPRLTLSQRRCPPCELAVAEIIAADTKRRMPRFTAKELTPFRVPGGVVW